MSACLVCQKWGCHDREHKDYLTRTAAISERTTAVELLVDLAKYQATVTKAGYTVGDHPDDSARAWRVTIVTSTRLAFGKQSFFKGYSDVSPTAALRDAVIKLKAAVPKQVVRL